MYILIVTLCVQALLNNSYLYHMAHGKDFESRGIESKRLQWISSGSDEVFSFLQLSPICIKCWKIVQVDTFSPKPKDIQFNIK